MNSLPLEERRQLAAYLISLRHRDLAGYRSMIAKKIDDNDPDNWLSLEEYDQRLAS
jgi:hypothetical protein